MISIMPRNVSYLWSFVLHRENVSQLLNCEAYGPLYYIQSRRIFSRSVNCEVFSPLYYTEGIFRSYKTAKFMVLSIIRR